MRCFVKYFECASKSWGLSYTHVCIINYYATVKYLVATSCGVFLNPFRGVTYNQSQSHSWFCLLFKSNYLRNHFSTSFVTPQLDEQMTAFQSVTELSNISTRIRFLACQQVELCLRGIFAKAEVLPFGSSVNSFGKKNSDLDMAVVFDSTHNVSNSTVSGTGFVMLVFVGGALLPSLSLKYVVP